jgi:hypothetical protein
MSRTGDGTWAIQALIRGSGPAPIRIAVRAGQVERGGGYGGAGVELPSWVLIRHKRNPPVTCSTTTPRLVL